MFNCNAIPKASNEQYETSPLYLSPQNGHNGEFTITKGNWFLEVNNKNKYKYKWSGFTLNTLKSLRSAISIFPSYISN